MKNLLLLLVLLSMPLLATSQDKAIKTFYNKYKNQENVTDIKLRGWLIKLVAKFSDDEDAKALMKKVSFLRVLVMEEGNLVSKQEYQQLLKSVRKSRFEDLIQIRDGTDYVQLLIREDADTITDVLVLVQGEEEFVLLSLEGALRLQDLRQLDFDIEGGDHFKKIPKERPRA